MLTDEKFLQMALLGLESQKSKIDATIEEIRRQLGHRGPGRPPKAETNGAGEGAPKRRTMSAAARRRIALAQKRRWAAFHKQTAEPAKGAPTKRRRTMSAAGRARIVAATKKRWAAYRKAKANA